LNRWWPISATEFGSTIGWTYSVGAQGDVLTGSISATISNTQISSFLTDYNPSVYVGSWYRLGAVSLDISENPGWNQVFVQGGFRMAIYNRDGPLVNNHPFRVWTHYHVSWRGCGWAGCWGSEYWYDTDIYMGDNYGVGDGYIYVRTGSVSGS
jgi:hypothetical protein